jgi:formylglycine-generating enzyme required for sulfatase activity
MDKTKALQKLLNGTATKKEIELLKQALASGEISIGGDVKHSIVITGDGNNISLTPEALNLLKPETTSEEPAAGEPPYMGLRYFDTSDADLFYGRETLTRELLARVQKESFLAIVGASGSGKSSVARAGLIPAWQKENAERSTVHVITATAHPLESLAASLTRESESITATSTLMDDLMKDSRSLRLYVKKALGETKLFLLVDQFEETFTLCKDADERKAFIKNLLSLAEDDVQSAARVVITLRADFYAHCAEYDGLRLSLEEHQKYIGAMTPDELRQAITAPAQSAGWKFQPGLENLILQDVGTEPGALPLLSHALLETWKRRQGRTLTLKGYADAGGVKKAIAQTAESVYDKLTPAEQTIARRIFLRLTELGEGVQDTRRRVKLDELSQRMGTQDSVAKVLKILTDARLVTTAQDSAEVAHEALIREWGTLRKWLDEDRDSLRLHRHLTESAGEWVRRGRETGELYRGARLKQLQGWLKEHGEALSPLEREFVKASQNVKKRERLQRAAIASVGMALLLLIFFMPAGIINRLIYQPVDMEDYWVTIPAGEFQMGSENGISDESPVHTVYLDEYQIGKYEVTNRQYNNCRQAGVCSGTAVSTNLDHPVVNVSWHNAKTYCEWVDGRLPTEAEWEKAARGTDGRTYPWGEGIDCDKANYDAEDYCVGGTSPIGSYESGKSPYGVYDMAGNVYEWVNDWYDGTYYQNSSSSNPLGPSSGSARVLRGGSWDYYDSNARSSLRFRSAPSYSDDYVGFRCARDVP